MESLNPSSAFLSNFEVVQHLQKLRAVSKKQKGQLATITYETLRYLEDSPCKGQEEEKIKDYMKHLEPYGFSKKEKLMMVNTPPANALEIQLIMVGSEERLTDDQVSEILSLVKFYFSPPNTEECSN